MIRFIALLLTLFAFIPYTLALRSQAPLKDLRTGSAPCLPLERLWCCTSFTFGQRGEDVCVGPGKVKDTQSCAEFGIEKNCCKMDESDYFFCYVIPADGWAEQREAEVEWQANVAQSRSRSWLRVEEWLRMARGPGWM